MVGKRVSEMSDQEIRELVDGRASAYVRFDDMTWPHPHDPTDIEWRLRYGEPTRSDLLVAASYIGAYRQLVDDPQRTRDHKIRGIRAAVELRP